MGAENPIFQKHVRSRLRREGLVPAAIGVAVSAGFLVWSAALTGNIRNGQALVWLLGLQGFLLFVLGSARVAGAIAGARDSGILDFHRISRVSPLRMAVGFMLGAPVREYALFAITLPVALALPALGYPHPLRIVVALLLLVCATLLYHCAAALIALEMPKARNAEALAVAFPLMAQVGGLYLSASCPLASATGSGGSPWACCTRCRWPRSFSRRWCGGWTAAIGRSSRGRWPSGSWPGSGSCSLATRLPFPTGMA